MTYKVVNENSVLHIDSGTVFPYPALESFGFAYQAWLDDGNTPIPAEPPIPQEVTMRQARLALLAIGKLASVEVYINSLTDPPKSAARIEWEVSNTVKRDNEFVLMIGEMLGMSEQDLDTLFIEAAKL